MAFGILNEQEERRVTETRIDNNLFIIVEGSLNRKDSDLLRYTIGGTIITLFRFKSKSGASVQPFGASFHELCR